MTNFDLNIDGVQATAQRFRELEEQYEGDGVTYIVGTNVEYAVYLEFGTEKMPPYPFFRPAVREYKANPERFIQKNTELGGVDEVESTERLVGIIARALENQMKVNATAQAGSGRSPGTDEEHPKVDTGTLRSSILAVRID